MVFLKKMGTHKTHKNSDSYNGISKLFTVLTAALLLLAGLNSVFAQKRVTLDENSFQKFKLSKRMFEKGKVYFLKGKYKKSEKALKDCLKGFPQYSQADYFLAQIYYKSGDLGKAVQHIESAKKYYGVMADLLTMAHQKVINRLIARRQELNTEDPRSPEINRINDRLNEPIPVLPERSAEYYYVHGNIMMKLKKFNEAFSQYSEALKINPQHGNASNNLANLYYMAKKYQKALYYLEQAEANGAKINPKFKAAVQKALTTN